MSSVREDLMLAAQHHQAGRLQIAEQMYRQILKAAPKQPDAVHLLGVLALQSGRFAEAVEQIQLAIAYNPKAAPFHNNLGTALQRQGKLAEAVLSHQRALSLQPDFVDAHFNLATVLMNQGRLVEAIPGYQRAVSLKPDYVDAHNNLGNVFRELGKLDEAIQCYQQALRYKPNFAQAWNNMGNALKDQGELDAAIAAFRRALESKPDYVTAHSNLVYALSFSPNYSASAIYDEHVRWNQQHAISLSKDVPPHSNDRNPQRRLRVGYVSPDFCNHSVGRFLTPLLANHDHQNFEIFCYSSVSRPDDTTRRFQSQADTWRNVGGLNDEELANLIRQDQIDILVDLTMHMAQNRLLVFARRPAPVQVTYLAYCGTTGLTAMDYRLTDPYLDPPDSSDQYYSEESIRLPESYWCYPVVDAPEVKPVPALQTGYVTFGCLNNFAKVTTPTLEAWIRLLEEVPNSKLVLHGKEGRHRVRVQDYFRAQQIAEERLKFIEFLPVNKYLEVYEQIDIALDPFPYGGGTTTCDALWMGVPVVTLSGQTAVGRGGRSILLNAGLPELVADSTEDYVHIALELAGDLPRLSGIRSMLRERIRNSPLMDAPRFTRGLEAACRDMWQRWCLTGT